MSQKFLFLEEAAKMLGISPDKLNHHRDQQKIRAFRDGSNWKYRSEDVEKFAQQMSALADDDSSESSEVILLSDQELGGSPAGASSTIIGGRSSESASSDSDLRLGEESSIIKPDSDVKLVPQGNAAGDSDVKLVSDAAPSEGVESSFELNMDEDLKMPSSSEQDILTAKGKAEGSSLILSSKAKETESDDSKTDLRLDNDESSMELSLDSSSAVSEDDIIPLEGEKRPAKAADQSSVLEDDDEVLPKGGSDVTLNAGDSGISLLDAKDSGLSLDDMVSLTGEESASLEIGDDEILSLSDDSDSAGITEIKEDSDFFITPLEESSAGMGDEDSGSHVITLDESSEEPAIDLGSGIGQMMTAESPSMPFTTSGAQGFQPMMEAGAAAGLGMVPAQPASQYSTLNIISLGTGVFFMMLCGMMMFDLIKNMWSWDGPFAVNSSLMDLIVGLFG